MQRRGMSRGFRRQRRPVQWFTNNNVWGGIGGTAVAASTLVTQGMILAANPIGTEQPEIDRLTLFCIRGQLVVQSNDAVNAGLWMAGIYISDTVTGAAVNALDPSVAADAARSNWLWLRTGFNIALAAASLQTSNSTDGMNGVEVFVKVKRVMRPGQELRVAIKTQRASLYTINLRALIGRVA